MTRDILKNAVNLCKIRNDGREYITLYYFSVSDAHERLLHRGNQIVCFESDEQAMEFCDKNRLLLQEKIIYLDYDEEITRDIMAVSVVRKWNILDSMSTVFGIKSPSVGIEYDRLYDYIFSRAASENVSIFLSKEQTELLKKAFVQGKRVLSYLNN